MARDAHLKTVLKAWGKDGKMMEKVTHAKILVVGAGGIGCELLKSLVLSGFKDIEIIDLDVIDTSNLNRQFLFRKEHVGLPKATVAAEAARKMCPDVRIVPHLGNVMTKEFGTSFFGKFDVVFNALDNIEARRHVNRICVHMEKPLIDGGTQGYDGQVCTIVKGKSACYDCEPKPTPKGFPVCTIRSTPDKPIHCIVWAKHLFGLLFGDKDDPSAEANAVTDASGDMTGPELLKKLYIDDIEAAIKMTDLWEKRKPPVPIDAGDLKGEGCKTDDLDAHSVWSIAQTAAVFAARYNSLKDGCKAEGKSLEFDKDVDPIMDFVTCAANLRSKCYGIELQTLHRVQDIAGNIIPAIATTNAIIAGSMVLECLKIVDGRMCDCRVFYRKRTKSGSKGEIFLQTPLDEPSGKCVVCGGGAAMVTLNVEKTELRFFVEKVLQKGLQMGEPSITVDNGNFIECIAGDEDYVRREKKTLVDPSIKIVHGAILQVEDDSSDFSGTLTITVTHNAEFDPEGDKPFELKIISEASAKGGANTEEAAGDADDDDDMICMPSVDAAPAGAEGGAKRGAEGGDEGGGKRSRNA